VERSQACEKQWSPNCWKLDGDKPLETQKDGMKGNMAARAFAKMIGDTLCLGGAIFGG